MSSSCSSVYVDGSEIRGSSNASVLVKYGTYTGLARFTVWMPEFPLEVTVSDPRLNQIKSWKVPEEHLISKNKRSLNETSTKSNGDSIVRKRSSDLATESSDLESDDDVVDEEEIDDDDLDDEDEEDDGSLRFRGHKWDEINAIDRNPSANCRLRFQQSPVEVHARSVQFCFFHFFNVKFYLCTSK